MDMLIAEIAERAKRLRGEYDDPPATVVGAPAPAPDHPSPSAPPAQAVPWQPRACLYSVQARRGRGLPNVLADGKRFFLGSAGMEFGIAVEAPPGVKDFHVQCFVDGRKVFGRVYWECQKRMILIPGFDVDGNTFPFMFAPAVIASDADHPSRVTSAAGQIRVVLTAVSDVKIQRVCKKVAEAPVSLVLERTSEERKFFDNPGLTVQPGAHIASCEFAVTACTKLVDLGEYVCYFDTEDRLRLRGILPPLPEVQQPEAKRSPAKRAKVSEFLTMIDITGDEPIISRIKKESLVVE